MSWHLKISAMNTSATVRLGLKHSSKTRLVMKMNSPLKKTVKIPIAVGATFSLYYFSFHFIVILLMEFNTFFSIYFNFICDVLRIRKYSQFMLILAILQFVHYIYGLNLHFYTETIF